MEARLFSETDISGFRFEAGQLLAHRVPPEAVHWETECRWGSGRLPAGTRGAEHSSPRPASAIVPPSFQRLCELVVMHRDPDRFALLYRLLWRLVHEPGLRGDPLDPEFARAQHMGHAVRREIHKLKNQLRFRLLAPLPGDTRPLQLAWCEPVHHTLEVVAQWMARRMPEERWAILSPLRSADWDGRGLLFGPGLSADAVPEHGAPDEAWHRAWARVLGGQATAAQAG